VTQPHSELYSNQGVNVKRDYIYAEEYGTVWRFSKRQWLKMLRVVANGGTVLYREYGHIVVPEVQYNITDLDQETAKDHIEVASK
jgi:hypothetical protein